ncbi:MAG: hypothetical protein A3F46_10990 [Legionellales bacterium RIFCSPHIGHO2_12_FULL_42_9]|nr:MAG: hypothetical protein A3F46_10990 [Legionellales bacterium RIFCSPHIGHO2_12_FULL_42_9]
MNGLKLTGAIGLLLASSASFSLNPTSGWYVGLVGGGTDAPTVNWNVVNPIDNSVDKAEISYLIGGNGGAMLGYRTCNLRVELEAFANDNKFKQIQLDNFTLGTAEGPFGLHMSGYTYFISGIVNAIYEFYQAGSDRTNFVPYLGLGIGYAYTQSGLKFSSNITTLDSATTSRNAGIAQGIAGLNYFIDDFAAVGIDYRYMVLSKTTSVSNYFQPQTINLSFTYAFGK